MRTYTRIEIKYPTTWIPEALRAEYERVLAERLGGKYPGARISVESADLVDGDRWVTAYAHDAERGEREMPKDGWVGNLTCSMARIEAAKALGIEVD